jgi:hypothetical protein
MRLAPTVPVGLQDLKLITLLTSVVKCLKNQPDHECYTMTVVWQVPFLLLIPERGNTQPRNIKPNIIRLGNAVLTEKPETVVEWGAATNWVWQGNSQVKILNQAGLLEGVRYTLTFEVVS